MKVAIIPARKGSKRVPRKNIKAFCNKPMISYAIDAAIKAQVFDRIIVSTDCPEIAEISIKYGAETPFVRPEELSDDHTGTGAVVVHGIEWLSRYAGEPDLVCCIYPTVPLLQENDLLNGLHYLEKFSDKLYAFSVTDYAFPVHRAMKVVNDELAPLFPEHLATRSQDLPEVLHDAGMFYWGRPQGFLKGNPMFGPDAIPIRIPRYRVLDIDTPEDWIHAELMFQAYQNNLSGKNK